MSAENQKINYKNIILIILFYSMILLLIRIVNLMMCHKILIFKIDINTDALRNSCTKRGLYFFYIAVYNSCVKYNVNGYNS
jgi:hypothetical protein